IGVALIDLAPRAPGAAVGALLAQLERERFDAFFPGELPVAAIVIAETAIEQIGERLAAAFDALPRIDIADRDWADAGRELLLTRSDLTMMRPSTFDAQPEETEPDETELADEAPCDTDPIAIPPPPEHATHDFTLRAEDPIAYEPPARKRPGRVAAVAVA